MSDTTKRSLRILGVGVIWVYVLSIRVGGQTLFGYANDILVQNPIVEAIDHTLADAVDSLANRVSTAFRSWKGTGDEANI